MLGLDWKKPLILATILVVLSGVVYWNEFSVKPKKEAAEENNKRPFDLKTKAVDTITIHDGKTRYSFKCLDLDKKLCKLNDASKWQMLAPETLAADDSNVNALLASMANFTASEVIDLSTEEPAKRATLLKDYGLDPETRNKDTSLKVEIKTQDGKLQRAFIGNVHPIGDKNFVLSEIDNNLREKSILLAASHFKSNLDHNLTYWRNKKISLLTSQDVHSFELVSKKGKTTAIRRDGQWILNDSYVGDIENIDNFITGTVSMNAKEFLKLSSVPHQAPEVKLVLHTTDKKIHEFSLFKSRRKNEKTKLEEDWFMITIAGATQAYETDSLQRDHMNLGLSDLRLVKLITSVERFSAKKLKFKDFSIEYKDGKWVSTTDAKAKINQDKVSQLLEKLAGNRIAKFLPEVKNPEAKQESVEVALLGDKDEVKRKYLIWKTDAPPKKSAVPLRKDIKPDPADVYILYAKDLNSTRKETFQLDIELLDALPWKKEMLTQ